MAAQNDHIPAWVEGRLQPMGKLAVHQLGLRHQAISVFVVAEGQILLQRRALGKYHTPGLWANTCCTHPHWDEDHLTCATRRLSEELGITGLSLQHRGQVEYRADVGNGLIEHEVVQLFLAETTLDLAIIPNPGEVAEVAWCDPDTLAKQMAQTPETFTPWLRIYLSQHREMIFAR